MQDRKTVAEYLQTTNADNVYILYKRVYYCQFCGNEYALIDGEYSPCGTVAEIQDYCEQYDFILDSDVTQARTDRQTNTLYLTLETEEQDACGTECPFCQSEELTILND